MRSQGHSFQTRRFLNLSCFTFNSLPLKFAIPRLEMNHFDFGCQDTLSSVKQCCSVYCQMPAKLGEAFQLAPKLGTASARCLEPGRFARHSKAVMIMIGCLPKIPFCFKFRLRYFLACFVMMAVCLEIVTMFNSNLARTVVLSLDCFRLQLHSLSSKGYLLSRFE